MTEVDKAIAHYLGAFRAGAGESAFFGLLELRSASILVLCHRYQCETDPDVRRLLLEVIWQRRDKSAIPFLGRQLLVAEGPIWRTSLDGLVAMPSQASLEELRRTRGALRDAERLAWLDEAIEQVNSALGATPQTTS